MKCPLCKGQMVQSVTSLPYEIGSDKLIVVSEVPALVCKQCGEYFVEIEHLQKAEKMIDKAKDDGVTLGIVKYQKAA